MKKDEKNKKSAQAQEVSLDQIRDLLYSALRERNKDFWITEVFGSYIIYRDDAESKYYKLAYSIMEGEVQLGSEPVEVEKAWVDAKSQMSETDDEMSVVVKMGAAKNPEGTEWEVTICEPGFTKNGWYNSDKVLKAAADEGVFENVDVNLYEFKAGDPGHLPESLFDIKKLLVRNKVGWIDGVKHVAGEGLKGVLHFIESAKWLGQNMLTAMQDGKKIYGLSYDALVRAAKDTIDGRKVFNTLKFKVADSVDIVSRPAAGGKFNRAVASMPAHSKEDEIMKKKDLWEMISKARPDLLTGKELDSISDEDIEGLARMAMEPVKTGAGEQGTVVIEDPEDPPAVTQDDLKAFRCGMALDNKLDASELPDFLQKGIRAKFENKIFETTDLDTAIGEAKDFQAKMSEPPEGTPVPGSDIRVGIGTIEKAQMAVDRMFGMGKDDMIELARMERLDNQPFFEDMRSVQDYDSFDDVPAFRGLRDMYVFLTGDSEVTGRYNRAAMSRDMIAKMDITSSTFTYMLGNTLGRRLVKQYKSYKYLEDLIVSVKKSVKDFRQQEAVLVGGFPDIEDVDPESGDYQEIEGVTDEESTYTIGQKGNLLTITRKTIINDDITIIRRLVDGLSRAARRTHAKYIWSIYIDNDNCSDGTAVFTNGHGNLGATALSHATALVAWKALAAMTEKDSGEYLGLLDDADIKVNLIGPPALINLIGRIEKEEFYYSSNDLTTKLPNPLVNRVKGHTLSMLAGDANDWLMLLPPNAIDMIEMGYLNGREEPEMFVADTPQSEQVFVADKVRYKIRHEYAGAAIDYRGSYKAEVT
ncbi:MAG: hypothetical protein JRD05_00685 [Deltaproteobacteria bacterium]|nr:hypothetical protein [Deltaproteobacteria bacterium]